MPLACFAVSSPEAVVKIYGIMNSTKCQLLQYFSPKPDCLAKKVKAKIVTFIHT